MKNNLSKSPNFQPVKYFVNRKKSMSNLQLN